MRIPGPSRRLRSWVSSDVTKLAPSVAARRGGHSWVGLHELPVGHGPTGSSGRQPEPGVGIRGTSTAAGPGGGAALVGAPVVPPPTSPPAATANGPPPAIRQRVVLLPHTRTEHSDIRPNNRRTGRVEGMNKDDSLRRLPPQSDGARLIDADIKWHDAELAMKVARHSFERWLAAGHEDTPSHALTHAYHTHTALHEAARAITMLIETFRAEATALITTPARGADIPGQRGDYVTAENATLTTGYGPVSFR